MNAQDQTDTPQISAAALRALTSIGAAGLFAFGLICWIAANWASFHRLTKLELVAGTLLVSALAAAVLPRVRVPALLLATAAVGGLFALIGQTYPSGADAWQLFALWAALALPFALAGSSPRSATLRRSLPGCAGRTVPPSSPGARSRPSLMPRNTPPMASRRSPSCWKPS